MDQLYTLTPNEVKSLKVIITEKVLTELSIVPEPLSKYINLWWLTKSSGGLRLTDLGDQMFRKADIQFFDYPIKKDTKKYNWLSFLVTCGKKLKCPYYIGYNKEKDVDKLYIRLYDDRIAILLSLYGDINSYLESIRVRK
jgi:hypothetical protein